MPVNGMNFTGSFLNTYFVAAAPVELKAALLSAEERYGRWLRFAIPGALLVVIIGAIGVVVAA